MPRHPNESVEEPVMVLVSSREQEFLQLREDLKHQIELQREGNRWLFEVRLPEHSHRAHLKVEIDKLLAMCSIIIVLIGRESSKWVTYEVDYAISNGIPILAYEYYRRRRAGLGSTKTRSLVRRLRNADIKLRGHKGEFQSRDDVVAAVLEDLPEIMARIANHYAAINREVSKRV